jgi:hypothetical protein
VPVKNCNTFGANTLLYVGISPKKPPKDGSAPSKQKLVDRIRNHYRGNAKGSTLRLTLGCLLSERLGLQLRRIGNGTSMTFGSGESILSQWMAENAFVAWVVDPLPWLLESSIIGNVSLPLNLAMNNSHPFHQTLSNIRKAATEAARALPVDYDTPPLNLNVPERPLR